MKLFSIFDEIKKKKELNKLIESTVVTYDSINESYIVKRQGEKPKQSWWDFLVSLWVEYAANREYEHKSDWERIHKPNYNNTRINKYIGPNNHCTKKY